MSRPVGLGLYHPDRHFAELPWTITGGRHVLIKYPNQCRPLRRRNIDKVALVCFLAEVLTPVNGPELENPEAGAADTGGTALNRRRDLTLGGTSCDGAALEGNCALTLGLRVGR